MYVVGDTFVIFNDLQLIVSYSFQADLIQSQTDSRLTSTYCCFMTILMHQSCFEHVNYG